MSDSSQTPFQILGEDGIRELADAFYDLMDTLPEAAGVRAMHAQDLAPMKTKLADYLISWMGGPPVYAQKYGTMCMTTPHEHYHIGPQERDQWLLCMHRALAQINASDELVAMLDTPLFRIADAIRNREGPSAAASDPNIIAAN